MVRDHGSWDKIPCLIGLQKQHKGRRFAPVRHQLKESSNDTTARQADFGNTVNGYWHVCEEQHW